MELQITGKNIKLAPSVRQHIERKLGKLGRHLPNIVDSKVEISEEKTRSPQQRFVVQVTIDSNNVLLRGEERGEDLFAAIDKVTEIMDRQIERYKGKRYDKGKGSSFARGTLGEEAEAVQLAMWSGLNGLRLNRCLWLEPWIRWSFWVMISFSSSMMIPKNLTCYTGARMATMG